MYDGIKEDLKKKTNETTSFKKFINSLKKTTNIIQPGTILRWYQVFIDLEYIKRDGDSIIFIV